MVKGVALFVFQERLAYTGRLPGDFRATSGRLPGDFRATYQQISLIFLATVAQNKKTF